MVAINTDMTNYLKDTQNYNSWKLIEHIKKGWSDDQKFFIEDKNGEKYLLKLSSISKYDKKKAEFNYLLQLRSMNINTPRPINFGKCGNGEMIYSLLSWTEGEDAIAILPTLNTDKQYRLGIEAGRMLKKIHSIVPLMSFQPWEVMFQIKIDKVLRFYHECGYKINNDEEIISYIKNNVKYLKHRPITFIHGDYHLGNMIITPEYELAIIDFNRYGYGDPFEEYDRFVFTWKTSTAFANGQLHGYFDGEVPDEFFRLMSLYSARNLIASIPWAISREKEDLKIAIGNADIAYEQFEGFSTHIPKWYKTIQQLANMEWIK